MMSRFLTAALCVLPVFGQASGTLVVDDDGGPGVDFTDLPAAVAAAIDGDTVVVREGTYDSFIVSGKALLILGDGSGTTFVSGGTTYLGGPGFGKVLHVEGLFFLAAS